MAVDLHEAARRISVIGNWMMLIPGIIATVYFLVVAISTRFSFHSGNLGMFDFILAWLPGIAVRLVAWVVDGLAGRSE